ncbi:MAG: hypothetical protein AAGA68_19390 [Pseudomonadota bacterium]
MPQLKDALLSAPLEALTAIYHFPHPALADALTGFQQAAKKNGSYLWHRFYDTARRFGEATDAAGAAGARPAGYWLSYPLEAPLSYRERQLHQEAAAGALFRQPAQPWLPLMSRYYEQTHRMTAPALRWMVATNPSSTMRITRELLDQWTGTVQAVDRAFIDDHYRELSAADLRRLGAAWVQELWIPRERALAAMLDLVRAVNVGEALAFARAAIMTSGDTDFGVVSRYLVEQADAASVPALRMRLLDPAFDRSARAAAQAMLDLSGPDMVGALRADWQRHAHLNTGYNAVHLERLLGPL